jgi:serralysin
VIADFESYIDLIDLRAIDANTRNGSAVNDAFTFMGGQSFTGIPGQLRVASSATVQIIEGDVNGDRKADFSIEVINTPTTLLLLEHDFLL